MNSQAHFRLQRVNNFIFIYYRPYLGYSTGQLVSKIENLHNSKYHYNETNAIEFHYH